MVIIIRDWSAVTNSDCGAGMTDEQACQMVKDIRNFLFLFGVSAINKQRDCRCKACCSWHFFWIFYSFFMIWTVWIFVKLFLSLQTWLRKNKMCMYGESHSPSLSAVEGWGWNEFQEWTLCGVVTGLVNGVFYFNYISVLFFFLCKFLDLALKVTWLCTNTFMFRVRDWRF